MLTIPNWRGHRENKFSIDQRRENNSEWNMSGPQRYTRKKED